MTLARYCKLQGMTFDEYEAFESMIESKADSIISLIGEPKNNGMYFETSTIIQEDDQEVRGFIINALRKRGVEFIDNCELYRY